MSEWSDRSWKKSLAKKKAAPDDDGRQTTTGRQTDTRPYIEYETKWLSALRPLVKYNTKRACGVSEFCF